MLKNYIKTAFRSLWKNKIYGFLNIGGLAVGIACAVFIFLWTQNELTYDHQHVKKDCLYEVMENQSYDGKVYTFAATPGPLAEGMIDDFSEVANTCKVSWPQSSLFSLEKNSIYEQGYYVDSTFFSLFTFPFKYGNTQRALSELHSLVITEKMAKKFFGNENPVGKTLKVDNTDDYIVEGVMKDIPENSTLQFSWLAPYKIYYNKNNWLQSWGNNGIQTFVEMNPNANLSTFNKKFKGYIKTKAEDAAAEPFLFPMDQWHLYNHFEGGEQTGGRIEFVRLFTIIAWIILFIACINFMNLATARSEQRAREVGVRKALGAIKRNLIGQFMSESFFLSLAATLLAIGIIYALLPQFNTLVDEHLLLDFSDPLHLTGLLIITIICGLLAGSYPALYLSSFNPVKVFKGMKIKSTGSASFIRKSLVVVQFAVSTALIICTLVIYEQIQHVKSRQLGYNKNNLLITSLQGSMREHFEAIKQDLLATNVVENAALASHDVLYMGSSSGSFTWKGKDPTKDVLITMDQVSPEYLSTLGMPLADGRNFESSENEKSGNVLINETLAKVIGSDRAVGMTISHDADHYQVIGVVKNFVFSDMYGEPDPVIFFCEQSSTQFMYIRLKQDVETEQALNQIKKVINADNPGYPFDYHFLDDQFNELFKSEMLIGKLSRVFAALAIIISCLGLFGLAAYMASRRTKEIGIRKVMGATIFNITTLLSKDFLKLILISALIAFPVSWYTMHLWLQNFAYRVDIYWWLFVAAGTLALFIALLTVSFQSIKAAVANPVDSLRSE